MDSPRIAFYATAGFSAGHHQCLANVARALVREAPDAGIFLVQPEVYGGVRFRPTARLPQCMTVELPSAVPEVLRAGEVPTAEEERALGARSPEIAASRRRAMEQGLGGVAIDVLVIESFPLLTQQEKGEVEHLLACVRKASPGVVVLASVRDVLFGRRADVFDPATRRYAENFVLRETNKLLVHADPTVVRLEDSYPDVSALSSHVAYTGVIVPPLTPRKTRGRHVVCSLGGGRKWRIPTVAFIEAWAKLAAEERIAADVEGYVFCGLEGPEEELLRLLREDAKKRPGGRNPLRLGAWGEYANRVATAACSISMCGYNTAYELLALRVPAVFSPRAHNGPGAHPLGEQGLRAQLLARRGWASVAETGDAIADEIERRLRSPAEVVAEIDFLGAETTARMILDAAAR